MTEQLSQCLVLIIYICVNITIIINLYVEYHGHQKIIKDSQYCIEREPFTMFREGLKKIWIFPDLV